MSSNNAGFLDLNEVERLPYDVKADAVKVIPVEEQCGWTDYMVIATGKVIIHALDEKARDNYCNLESIWTADSSKQGQIEDLDKVLVKIRRKNNSKKPIQKTA